MLSCRPQAPGWPLSQYAAFSGLFRLCVSAVYPPGQGINEEMSNDARCSTAWNANISQREACRTISAVYPVKFLRWSLLGFFFSFCLIGRKRGSVRPLVINQRASLVYETPTQLPSKCSVTWYSEKVSGLISVWLYVQKSTIELYLSVFYCAFPS